MICLEFIPAGSLVSRCEEHDTKRARIIVARQILCTRPENDVKSRQGPAFVRQTITTALITCKSRGMFYHRCLAERNEPVQPAHTAKRVVLRPPAQTAHAIWPCWPCWSALVISICCCLTRKTRAVQRTFPSRSAEYRVLYALQQKVAKHLSERHIGWCTSTSVPRVR